MSFALVNNSNNYSSLVNRLFCYYSSEYDCLVTTGLYHGLELEFVKDIIHQLFLDFAEKKIDMDAFSNPRAYILTSFKRRIIDHHRTSARKAKNEQFDYSATSELSIDKLIEESEVANETVRKLRDAYEKLPERCRKVIFLKFYERLSNDEIMTRTGLSARSVYNNLSEGLKMLRSRMTEQQSSRIQGLKKIVASYILSLF